MSLAVPTGFALFDTAIGVCGIAWTDAGIARVQLPEGSVRATQARLARFAPSATETAPPPLVAAAIDAIVRHLAGATSDIDSIALDSRGLAAFPRAVYEETRRIPRGHTRTYGAIAAALGDAGEARAVGVALGRNPWPIIVPCHRVVGARGATGGFSAHGGAATKRRLLEIEGWHGDEQTLDLFAAPNG